MNTAEYEKFVNTNWGLPGKFPGFDIDSMTLEQLRAAYADLRNDFIMTTGLAGETGEVMEHLKKRVRNGVLDKEELGLELGDALHYLTRVATRFGFTLEDLMEMNKIKLLHRAAERGWVQAHPNGAA